MPNCSICRRRFADSQFAERNGVFRQIFNFLYRKKNVESRFADSWFAKTLLNVVLMTCNDRQYWRDGRAKVCDRSRRQFVIFLCNLRIWQIMIRQIVVGKLCVGKSWFGKSSFRKSLCTRFNYLCNWQKPTKVKTKIILTIFQNCAVLKLKWNHFPTILWLLFAI